MFLRTPRRYCPRLRAMKPLFRDLKIQDTAPLVIDSTYVSQAFSIALKLYAGVIHPVLQFFASSWL
jgi:hypothetical protein